MEKTYIKRDYFWIKFILLSFVTISLAIPFVELIQFSTLGADQQIPRIYNIIIGIILGAKFSFWLIKK